MERLDTQESRIKWRKTMFDRTTSATSTSITPLYWVFCPLHFYWLAVDFSLPPPDGHHSYSRPLPISSSSLCSRRSTCGMGSDWMGWALWSPLSWLEMGLEMELEMKLCWSVCDWMIEWSKSHLLFSHKSKLLNSICSPSLCPTLPFSICVPRPSLFSTSECKGTWPGSMHGFFQKSMVSWFMDFLTRFKINIWWRNELCTIWCTKGLFSSLLSPHICGYAGYQTDKPR